MRVSKDGQTIWLAKRDVAAWCDGTWPTSHGAWPCAGLRRNSIKIGTGKDGRPYGLVEARGPKNADIDSEALTALVLDVIKAVEANEGKAIPCPAI